ncbi:MAG: RNA methyltransferase [Alphaproteobacteria bacterium]|nr:RNA methyltransferase [Alphaproteobacteria bacterium]MBF0250466.1 RNA methyltransferase [Alphaproteobacteria bacterium]
MSVSQTSTKHRRPSKTSAPEYAEGGPAVVLVEPQMGENIGMVARAMLNCALTDLRLVAPRDGWPNDKAYKTASGADAVLDGARVYATTAEAVADLTHVYATTARARDMTKDVLTPRGAAAEMRALATEGGQSGILFGKEAVGLHNDDIALADSILMVPLNPGFTSLNLAQAVLLAGYEWFQAAVDRPGEVQEVRLDTRRATKEELVGLFEHLERELDDCGFLSVAAKRPTMVRNLRNMFQRARMTEQEVRTFRGVIAGLVRKRTGG